MTIKKSLTVLSLIVAASITLTACSGTAEPTPKPSVTAPATTEPTPVETPDEGEQISGVEDKAVDIDLAEGQTTVEYEGQTYECESGAIAVRIKTTPSGTIHECVLPVDDEIGGLIEEHVGE
ncbi:hypothetical protein [Microbacterium sp. p3-SID336]|uniref:hypothetical protein n=1 Tax=Microbacterium sp. p3-SID336 TaxID=2916212 RepID=UPI0021A34E61|nr:hypothetical protein [Microbacterium sp. p3-SID336]MCT1478305.1 hypothetical protein [Microbacterium sp. p3-SID336]